MERDTPKGGNCLSVPFGGLGVTFMKALLSFECFEAIACSNALVKAGLNSNAAQKQFE
jgi:hypothetical protein